MTSTDQHPNEGREVSQIFWPDSSDGDIRRIKTSKAVQLRFHSEYLGDHSENWVLEISGGREMRQHNTRYIETIIWIED